MLGGLEKVTATRSFESQVDDISAVCEWEEAQGMPGAAAIMESREHEKSR